MASATRPRAALLGLVLLVAACRQGADRPTGPAAPSPAAPTPSAVGPATSPSRPESPPVGGRGAGVVLRVDGSAYGPMLFDGSGQAIYLFDRETGPRPRCYGPCAEAWPPVLARGVPSGRAGIREGLLGTAVRRDGTRQVTYAGHPLYYYAHEGKGQVLCHDVAEYGGVWLVVTPAGDPAPSTRS